MNATGNSPAKRGASSGLLGRGFSPFLREALQHVRSLHIADFNLKTVGPPSIPRDILNSVHSVVIHTAEGWYLRHKLPFPTGLLAMKPMRLYLRLAQHYRVPDYGCNFVDSQLPPSVKQIHCLISAHSALQAAPTFQCGSWYHSDRLKSHPTVTVVLLPRAPGVVGPTIRYGIAPSPLPSGSIPSDFCTQLISASEDSTIRLVGGEYLGLLDDGRPLCALRPHIINQSPRLTFSRFREWLDEQEPGAVFSAEEERELRALDEGYIAQLEATATVSRSSY